MSQPGPVGYVRGHLCEPEFTSTNPRAPKVGVPARWLVEAALTTMGGGSPRFVNAGRARCAPQLNLYQGKIGQTIDINN